MAADGGLHDIRNEPHLRRGPAQPDPSEWTAARPLPQDDRDQVNHGVWDEPALRGKAAPRDAVTYAGWLRERKAAFGAARSWPLALALALGAGPWALLGAFFGSMEGGTIFSLVAVTVIGPVVEELVKVSAPLIAIERRPYWFTHPAQILFACALSGLVFGLIENQLYFHVYIKELTPDLMAWRNSACLLLHTGCSLVAGWGLVRMWRPAVTQLRRPRPEDAADLVTIACVIHGVYNGVATLLDPLIRW